MSTPTDHTDHVSSLIADLQAERGPLVEKVVAADEQERKLQDELRRFQAANQSARSRLLAIDQALGALRLLESSTPEAEQVERAEPTNTITGWPIEVEGKTQQSVITVLRAAGHPMGVNELWDELEKRDLPRSANLRAFQVTLSRMYRVNQLSRMTRGLYGLREWVGGLSLGPGGVSPQQFRPDPQRFAENS